MPPRAQVTVGTQLGLETTPGTGVTAAKRLLATTVDLNPAAQTDFFSGNGNKYATSGVKHREYAEGSYQGIMSYNDIVYILGGLFGHSAPSAGAGSSYTWTFSPSSTSSDTIKTFTVQQGDAEAAFEATYGTFCSMSLDWGDTAFRTSGDFLAQKVDNAATLDTVTATIAEQPVSLGDMDWYIDSAFGSIGTTKWTDVMSATLTYPRKLQPKFVQNTSYLTYKDLVEVSVEDTRLSIVAEYNAQTRALYNSLSTYLLPAYFIRSKGTGDLITTGVNYLFQGNYACKFESMTFERGVQNVLGARFNFRVVHDPTMGRALSFSVVNKLPSL